MAEEKKYQVVCQKWEESERDWGTRPDGYSLHLTDNDREAYIRDYWDSMPDSVPDEYSRPDGTPYLCPVNEETWNEIKASKNGIRSFDSVPYPYGKDGWIPRR